MGVAEEQFQERTGALDQGISHELRGMPPTPAWQRLVADRSDVDVLRSYVKGQFRRGVLEVNSEDSSWSEESLLLVGGVLDRLLSLLGLRAVGTLGVGQVSVLSEEAERRHQERVVIRRAKREAYLAARAEPKPKEK